MEREDLLFYKSVTERNRNDADDEVNNEDVNEDITGDL